MFRKRQSNSQLIQSQLAALLSKGHSVKKSLQIMIDAFEGEARENIQQLSSAYDSTQSLARALSRFPKYFEPDFIHLVDVAEREHGDLVVVIRQYQRYQNALDKILSVVRLRLTNRASYLMALLSVFFVVLTVYSIFVLPQFASMFSSFGAPLPGITEYVLDLAGVSTLALIGLVLIVSIAAIVFLTMVKRFLGALKPWQKSARFVPLLGGFMRDVVGLRFLCYLDLLGDGGVTLAKSVGAVATQVGVNRPDLKQDEVQSVLRETKLFRPETLTLLKVSTQTGTLDSELKNQIDMNLTRLLDKAGSIGNPAMFMILLVLALIIGAVVYGMYLPIFKLGTVI